MFINKFFPAIAFIVLLFIATVCFVIGATLSQESNALGFAFYGVSASHLACLFKFYL